jgi:hypothetical protein
MPVQQLAPPTLNEISQETARFEERFGVSTAEFLANENALPEIDEDDAVEWLYLAEQLKALQQVAAASPYARNEVGKALKNSLCVMDRLAA